MRLFFGSILSLAFLNLTQAQPSENAWTLSECVDHALENNIQVRTTALQTEINQNNLKAAKWNRAPNLNTSANGGWNFGLNIDPVTNQISESRRFTSTFNLTSSWVLYDGGRNHNTIAQNNHEYLAALYDLEAIKNDVSLNVASAYLQILLNREILEVALEQENISRLQVERTQKLVDAGSAPRGELLDFEAQLARDEQSTVSAQNALDISILQLANLLQLENPEQFRVSDPELDLPGAGVIAYAPRQIYEKAVENQPVIKAAEERIASSEEGLELSRAGYHPTLSLQGQVATRYSDQIQEPNTISEVLVPVPVYQNGGVIFQERVQVVPGDFEDKGFTDQLSDNVNEFFGAQLSVPLFNRMQVKANVQNSKVQREISQLQLEQEKNTLRQNIYQAHADAKASYNSYRAAEKSVKAGEESFKYAGARFQAGAINQFDFENAKNSLAVAQSEMLRSKYDYIFKAKVLEFYLTNQIKLADE